MKTKEPIEDLRGWVCVTRANGLGPLGTNLEELDGIADEIEAQYMRLPVDADGVSIRPGDEVRIDPQSPTIYEVEAVNDDEVVLDGMFLRPADECRHVKPETVESILGEAIQFGAHAATGTRLEGVIAEYAERIRKAVER